MVDPFKSKAERYFWQVCPAFSQMVPELEEYQVSAFMYEAITFHLSGTVKYKPDFYLKLVKGDQVLSCIVEIKGAKEQKGYAATRAKLMQCVAMFPEFVFCEVLVNGSRSEITGIELLTKPPFAIMTFLDRGK